MMEKKNRYRLFILLILSISLWVITQVKGDRSKTTLISNASEKPDFYFEGFFVRSFDENGKNEFLIEGDKLSHFPTKKQTEFNDNIFTYYGTEVNPWVIKSKNGFAKDNNSLITFNGDVTIDKDETESTEYVHIKTADLFVKPNIGIATTKSFINIDTNNSNINGNGMNVNMKKDQLEILNNVKGTHEKR